MSETASAPASDGWNEVCWPSAPRLRSERKALAPRLAGLAGKRIALLWTWVFRGDETYAVLQRELQARYPGISFVGWEAFGNIHGTDEREVVARLPQRLRELEVDAVLTAMGC